MEKLINREQLAGMNIHYLFYSLNIFLMHKKKPDLKQLSYGLEHRISF